MYERKAHEALEINKLRTLNKNDRTFKIFWTDSQKAVSKRFKISYQGRLRQRSSLDSPKNMSLKIVPQVVICDICGT